MSSIRTVDVEAGTLAQQTPHTLKRKESCEKVRVSQWQNPCWDYFCGISTTLALAILCLMAFIHNARLFLMILSIVPTGALIYALYWRNNRDKLSTPLFWEMFWTGFLGAIPFVTVLLLLTEVSNRLSHKSVTVQLALHSFNAFIMAALLEEGFKYLCLMRISRTHEDCVLRRPTKPFGVVVAAFAASLGFATIENIGYMATRLNLSVAISRGLLSVPGHVAWGAMIGAKVMKSQYFGEPVSRVSDFFHSVKWPVLFHGLYDFFLMAPEVGYLDSKTTGRTLVGLGVAIAVLIHLAGLRFAWVEVKKITVQWKEDTQRSRGSVAPIAKAPQVPMASYPLPLYPVSFHLSRDQLPTDRFHGVTVVHGGEVDRRSVRLSMEGVRLIATRSQSMTDDGPIYEEETPLPPFDTRGTL